jgi:predicted nucleic acid-binding Zn ribbon protein
MKPEVKFSKKAKFCLNCGKEIVRSKKFCSEECREKHTEFVKAQRKHNERLLDSCY